VAVDGQAQRDLTCRGFVVYRGTLANGDSSVVVSTEKSVFSDDSGVRAAVLNWGVWAICLTAVLVGGALVLTLRTHVPLPGLDRMQAPSGGQVEGRAVLPTAESSSQSPQPSIRLRPSSSFRPAEPSPTAKRSAPTADATSSARTSGPESDTQATASAQETTKARNPKAATPTPRGSRPTSKPGNGQG